MNNLLGNKSTRISLNSISKFFTLHLVQARAKHDPVTARFCYIFDDQFTKTA